MNLKCGIVGLPNVGKSSLFNTLTAQAIPAENYPFCTIEPNVGIVQIPDKKLDEIASIALSKQKIPAVIEFVDIAGLVSGASKGEGLGNKFLSHVRETHAIIQVVRCYEDKNITHVDGNIDPIRDIETINTELLLADLEVLVKAKEKNARIAKSGNKEALKKESVFTSLIHSLDQGIALRKLNLENNEISLIKDLNLITLKKILYVLNISEDDLLEPNQMMLDAKTYVDSIGEESVILAIKLEFELALLNDEEKNDYMKSYGINEPGLAKLIRCAYELLGLHSFYTAGPKEARAWTIYQGATAPQAAGEIHTDFQKGFIRAEVISYENYIKHDGEVGSKISGKMKLEGKEYIVNSGDVIHFLFNV